MIYVLDSNVVIHYLKEHERVKRRLHQAIVDGYTLLIPNAVDYEVCRGLELLFAARKMAAYHGLTNSMSRCRIVDMGDEIWRLAKKIYVDLKRKGFTVGEIDILIASFCLHHNYTLVTANTKDFENIDGLRLDNWWAGKD